MLSNVAAFIVKDYLNDFSDVSSKQSSILMYQCPEWLCYFNGRRWKNSKYLDLVCDLFSCPGAVKLFMNKDIFKASWHTEESPSGHRGCFLSLKSSTYDTTIVVFEVVGRYRNLQFK